MKMWNRINNSDRKKLKANKVRIIIRGFFDDKFNRKKYRYSTVMKVGDV